ncbi:CU044_5270 family protein [Nocardioides aurantiacus]|uniref:CU044_5270 family protein n=1 Tax=Nocardioides aurantiacus TaxID=86796 RepID=A0A3N2CU50_9ACTN|nr:CU044_5270 family protein [Nocardioides aurantiacus]ROR90996.1 hypothetical protein EDD33_1854 [Nocardioides aurantiacus]
MSNNRDAHDLALITELHELAPTPTPRSLTLGRRTRLERSHHAHITQVERSTVMRTRRLAASFGPALTVAACVIAVASLAGLALTAPPPNNASPSLPVRADAAAVSALDALTVAASNVHTPAVADDQFVYVRSAVITNEGTLGGRLDVSRPHEREVWLSQSSRSSNSGLIREWGQDWPISSGYVVPAGPDRPTYQWIASLPADPDRILDELGSRQQVGSGQSVDQYTFERIGDVMSEGMVPPELAGALLQSLTKIAGVERVDRTQDAMGRPGFGIARTDERTGFVTELVFQPGSPSPLGTRWYAPGASSDSGSDVLFGATAVITRGVVDALGVRPDRPGSAPA